ncbi:PIN domain-containing protein [Phormidesmis priestleyi ULC007]|uniref:PIN domain-containing protein n=1 Tax=Phormidesmis priestleyi ULC007 TaxID=1920490 RepID=A0A2T1D5I4_9CYAN|nr:type II toxin-antitoxin system VapC family toxin [Phormidesmis priestleyi]PSB15739.1 PIN domain-containing protein [Phormidesmis priestleyi ULC007]PZO46423.1 MAG: PIN domain-containing protein [Phormidesmis priestleyi]
MPFLIDTNLLLRSLAPNHPMNPASVCALTHLRRQGEQLHIIPQNLIEFWNVYTRPLERNGLGRTPEAARAEIRQLKSFFMLLPDSAAIYPKWERLVSSYAVRGVNVHDARLVAAMLVHGLTNILTFNTRDFKRYLEITTVDPTSL